MIASYILTILLSMQSISQESVIIENILPGLFNLRTSPLFYASPIPIPPDSMKLSTDLTSIDAMLIVFGVSSKNYQNRIERIKEQKKVDLNSELVAWNRKVERLLQIEDSLMNVYSNIFILNILQNNQKVLSVYKDSIDSHELGNIEIINKFILAKLPKQKLSDKLSTAGKDYKIERIDMKEYRKKKNNLVNIQLSIIFMNNSHDKINEKFT